MAFRKGRGYLVSMVNLYHDTMPKSMERDHLAGHAEQPEGSLLPATTTPCSTA